MNCEMKKYLLALCILAISPAIAVGQEAKESGDSAQTKSSFMDKLRFVQQYLDNKARKKVDPRFIEVPDKPWRVILRYKVNEVDVDYDNHLESGPNDHSEWKLRFEPPMASSIGFWAGYRGTGVSYSYSLAKNAGRYFSVSTTGAKYGFNFRLRRFNTDQATLKIKDYENGDLTMDSTLSGTLPAPVWIRSVYINGYYVFNGRRYSQAAAYNQSVIQRRSAGSFLAGVTWYQSSLDYSDQANCLYIFLSHGIGRIKVHQANIGFGYGYNFVPFRGFVINAMAMPTISVYNRVKAYKYDSNYSLSIGEGETDDYGNWNPQTHTWDNGKSQKPLFMATDNDPMMECWESGSEIDYSAFHFNLDLRVGMAYNWKNYFIGLQAQYNNFIYKKDDSKVNIFDAYARIALGIRL